MQLTRFPKLSLTLSKRVDRRLKSSIGWIKIYLHSIVILTLFVFFILIFYNLFTIRNIKCSVNSEVCPTVIMTRLRYEIGSNSIFLNQKKIISGIKAVYPVEKINIGFKLFNTLDVSLTGSIKSFQVETYLVKNIPPISLDSAPGSTLSSDWPRPTTEIARYLADTPYYSYDIWENGTMTSIATATGAIKYVFDEKPSEKIIIDLYKILNLVRKYLNPQEIYILNNRVFLRQPNQPDIIVNIPFDEASLTQAFQSIGTLVTIKKDAKVIDLRFKNPIIR